VYLYATQDVEGTLASLPDPRLVPTSFATMSDARARSVGEQLDAFLQAVGLAPQNGAAIAQASATVAPTSAPTPLLRQPLVLLAIGLGIGYVLTKGAR
jgi:hypothetical protein